MILHYVEQVALENAQGEKYNLLFREINLRNAQSRKVLIILKQCGNALIFTMEFRKHLKGMVLKVLTMATSALIMHVSADLEGIYKCRVDRSSKSYCQCDYVIF